MTDLARAAELAETIPLCLTRQEKRRRAVLLLAMLRGMF
jgi:hypothetical protein